MTLSIIVAHCKNHVIGASGTMPWHLPADLAHFKSVTMGSPVIMGSNTYKSIGRPLPGRLNIVITYKATSCENIPDRLIHVANADEALKIAGKYDEVFIIGGGSVYRQFMDRADRMYITLIDAAPEGDTFSQSTPRTTLKSFPPNIVSRMKKTAMPWISSPMKKSNAYKTLCPRKFSSGYSI